MSAAKHHTASSSVSVRPLAWWIRKLHTYFGALFAPTILLFAASGLMQIYHLHRDEPVSGYRAPALIQALAALHKEQALKPPHPSADHGGAPPHTARRVNPDDPAANAMRPAADAPRPRSRAQQALQAYSAAMAVGLMLSALTGLYMGLQHRRDRAAVAGLLLAGVIIPLALLLL